jgi:hypothetical protein
MQELTKTQKSLAFEILMEWKQFGVSDWIDESKYRNLCANLGVQADYATVDRKYVDGAMRYDLLDCIKYAVSAPPQAFPASITPYVKEDDATYCVDPNCEVCEV